jgi:hypothetical protein
MNVQDKEERRKHKRFPFREDILIDGTIMCTSNDIGDGGLYVSAIQYFEENSIVNVTIPSKGKKLTVKARVQYCQPGIGTGLMFVELSGEQKTEIRELIEGITSR